MDTSYISQLLQQATANKDQALRKAEPFLAEARKWENVIEGIRELQKELPATSTTTEQKGHINGNNVRSVKEMPAMAAEGPEWDMSVSFRQRLKGLLRSRGRFTKVSELAKIAVKHDHSVSESEMQEKISRNLSNMKMDKGSGLVVVKVHPGASGVAWGFRDWMIDDHVRSEHAYIGEGKQVNNLGLLLSS